MRWPSPSGNPQVRPLADRGRAKKGRTPPSLARARPHEITCVSHFISWLDVGRLVDREDRMSCCARASLIGSTPNMGLSSCNSSNSDIIPPVQGKGTPLSSGQLEPSRCGCAAAASRLRAPGPIFHWETSLRTTLCLIPPSSFFRTEMDQCRDVFAGTPLLFSEV